jgi:hypothetical protein
MHKSIAKAELRGEFRKVRQQLLDIVNDLRHVNSQTSVGKKLVLEVLNALNAVCGSFNLFHDQVRRPSSWHRKECTMYICPESASVEGFGAIYPIGVRFFDTRVYMKRAGTPNAPFDDYTTKLVLHEHFLIRLRQRSGIDGYEYLKSKIALVVLYAHIYLAARSTVMEIDEEQEEPTTYCYLLVENHVFIATHHIQDEIIVLNTVINRERFTEKQKTKYEPLYGHFLEIEGTTGGFYNEKYDLRIPLDTNFLNYDNLIKIAKNLFIHDNIIEKMEP